jgi:hypothetical protein
MKYLIQYHNFEGQGGYPAKDAKSSDLLSEFTHSISSKKKHYILNSKNDIIFLIVGIRFNQNERKKFFLWSESPIDRFTENPDSDGWYEAYSEKQWFLYPPKCINTLKGFDDFKARTSNFSLGLMDISTWEILDQLKDLSLKYRCNNPNQITWIQYKENFEKEIFKEFGFVIRKSIN